MRGIPITIASSGRSRSAERSSIPRRSASAWATDGGPANAVAAESSTGSERSTSWRSRAGRRLKSGRSGEPAIRSSASGSYG